MASSLQLEREVFRTENVVRGIQAERFACVGRGVCLVAGATLTCDCPRVWMMTMQGGGTGRG